MIDEFDKRMLEKAQAAQDDLYVQAMFLDMDLDIETWSLVPKRVNETPNWIKKWKEKEDGKDFSNIDNGF